MNKGIHKKQIFIFATLLLIVWIAHHQHLVDVEKLNQFASELTESSASNIFIYMLFSVFFTAIGFSRQAIAFIGGYAYGPIEGLFYSVISTAIGSLLTYYFSLYVARPHVLARYPVAVKNLSDFLADDVFFKTLIVRLLPVGSNFLTNLVAGVAKVNTRQFLLGSALGFLPQMIVFSLTGAGFSVSSYTQIVVGILLFGILLAIGIHLHEKYQHEPFLLDSGR